MLRRKRQQDKQNLKKKIRKAEVKAKEEKKDKAIKLHSTVDKFCATKSPKTIWKSTLLAVQLVQEHNGQNKPKMIHTKT